MFDAAPPGAILRNQVAPDSPPALTPDSIPGSNHLSDEHWDQWDRFSWFGFCSVLKSKDEHGLQMLKAMAKGAFGTPDSLITDVEALLIRAMGLRNINQNNFSVADEWTQVKLDEAEKYLANVSSG